MPAMSALRLLYDPNAPALLPPPGNAAKFQTMSHARTWYYVFVVLCTTVLGCFIILRMYTKIFIVRKVDLTDCKYFTLSAKH
jgi:hypothetical protein